MKTAERTLWVTVAFGLLTIVVFGLAKFPAPLKGPVLEVADYLCRRNSGIKQVQAQFQQDRYTIVCSNGAHFLDTLVTVAPKVRKGPQSLADTLPLLGEE